MTQVNALIDEDDTRAVAVLATATMHVVGRDAPVVASLRQLLRDRSNTAYETAARRFDGLGAEIRQRIADSVPSLVRRKNKTPKLPGLLGVINRR